MKQLTKLLLVCLLLGSNVFFLPVRFKSKDGAEAQLKKYEPVTRSETKPMELHRHTGLASLE